MQKISVVIPVYNSVHFIDACLRSVLNQTYDNLEIIVVDDGSTDGSGAVCDSYAMIDNRIKVIHKNNNGVSAARNLGMKLATGDFISFIDSDDQLEEDMYGCLINLMVHYSADITHCGYKRMDENMNIIKEVSGTHKIIEHNNVEAIQCMLNGQFFLGGLWNKLFKREVVNGLQFCEELRNNEDVLFNVQAFSKAKKIVFIDETKYRYFEHSTSACNQLNMIKQHQDCVRASEIMLEIENDEIKKLVLVRLFNCRMNWYRFLILHPELIKKINRLHEKELFVDSYKKLEHPCVRERINYYMLIKLPTVYRLIYRIYDALRKPNWDVKGED